MTVADKLLQVNQVKQNIKNAIETKGIPMTDVAFTEYANKILDIIGGGAEVDEYFYYSKAYYTITNNATIFENAWEHSLTVEPLEISATSTSSNNRGRSQYPNGETEGVIIPQGVTSIGVWAFSNWEANDQPLVIPNSVTSIGTRAFYYWTSNNQPLVISDSVTSIGNDAFNGWISNNQSLTIPNSVTSIGSYAFANWSSNNQPLVIPNSVTSIGSGTFSNWESNNHPLVIPDSVTSIEGGAFIDWTSNNQPLVIPDSVTSIGNQAFRGWTSNNQPLVISDSVTSIGDIAFYGWSSNNQPLVIPNSVTEIGSNAFGNWYLVPYVEIQATTPPTLANSSAFSNQNNAPIYVPDESVDDYKTATNWVNLADRIFPISDK